MTISSYIQKILDQVSPNTKSVDFDLGVDPTFEGEWQVTVSPGSSNRIKFTVVIDKETTE